MTAGDTSFLLPTQGDYLVWYAKDVKNVKYHKVFLNKYLGIGTGSMYNYVENQDGTVVRKLTEDELINPNIIPKGWRVFRIADLKRQKFSKTATIEYEFDGKTYFPGKTHQWKTNKNGLDRLKEKGWLIATSNTLSYKRYFDDFSITELGNIWHDTQGASDKTYAVQTSIKVCQRAMIMTTDPGDLVLDITCGSGTTATVAEQWGRRWITCDTSRVALTLAKQRLMTANFDYYKLAHPNEGISSGFEYKTIPHITLKSIVNNEPPATETLYDQPLKDSKKSRITGPFTVEAVPAPYAKSFDDLEDDNGGSDTSIVRTGETHRQNEWKDELLRSGVRAKGGKIIEFSRVETMSGTKFIQAEAETKPALSAVEGEDKPKKILVVFGPEYAPLEQRQVENAWQEAKAFKPDILLFCAFQFDDEAAKDIDELKPEIAGMQLLKAQMNADMLTDDLRKKRSSNESFWLVGQPDVKVHKLKEGKIKVEVMGFDYYNPKTGNVDSGGKKNIAMWMLDTDYDNRSLFPSQVFFPMSGAKDGWSRLAKNLKAEIDEEKIEAFRGTQSLEFEPGKTIAVKIIDDRGIESLRVINL